MRLSQLYTGILASLALVLCSCSSAPRTTPTASGITTVVSISTPVHKIIHKIGDGGFLSEEPCGPPCFLNIIPGVTTETEVNTIIQGYYDLKDCDHWDKRREGGVHAIQCPRAYAGQSPTVGIDFGEHDIVDGLGFTPTMIIRVEEVITKYGQPDAIDILGWSIDNQETTSVTMKLFFDNIQAVVNLPKQAGTNYKLESSTQIDGIYYPGNPTFEEVRTLSQPWNGYGEYQGPYWSGP